MDRVDYSFMKTGNSIEGLEKLSKEDQTKLMSMISIYFMEAMKIAEGYVLYEHRKIVTSTDIVLALKAQALDHSDIWDTPEIKDKLQSEYNNICREVLNDDVDEDSDGEELVESDDGEIELDEDTVNFYKLEKSVYESMLTVNDRWKSWNPTNDLEIILKNSINNTENKMVEHKST